MGTWGVGIYQNDISADVKEDYIAKLKSGKSDEVALKEISGGHGGYRLQI